MKRRLFALALALLLAVSLPVSALAATWYLENGGITISATKNGQTVSQNGSTKNDDAPVITQTGSDTATENNITVSTTGDAVAEFTIRDVNISISTNGDAIDVGDSNAKITLEGENKLYSQSDSAVHVSGGDLTITGSGSLEADIGTKIYHYSYFNENAKIGSHSEEDMSGSIHITGDATITMKYDVNVCDGAGVGSGCVGNMSGSITIDGNANVDAFSKGDGAGIGSGDGGKMSGNITIGGNAQVTAGSGSDGAGIGSGWESSMSGNITIGDNAQVTAWSKSEGAGIGSGEGGSVSGTIVIGGSAQVTAGSNSDGAGIGSGEEGSVKPSGRIIIRDNATVTALGEAEGAGIGAGENRNMDGLIIIQDNAQVTAIAGDSAAAIGSNDKNDLIGTVLILGNARVTTEALYNDYASSDDDIWFDYDTKEIKYTLNENAIGYIGDGPDSHHASDKGHYVFGPNVTINGVEGSDTEALKKYVNMRLSGENHDGEPENLTLLDIKVENGEFTVTADGQGSVEKVLYDGEETVPTEPGEYPVTLALKLDEETTIEFEIGMLVIPEPPAEAAQPAPVYHVTDKDGNQISYTAAREGSVLTIRVDASYARLTLTTAEAQTLTAQGVEKVVFVTTGAASAFRPADLTAYKDEAPFVLTHDGETVAFTAGETDLAALLVQA